MATHAERQRAYRERKNATDTLAREMLDLISDRIPRVVSILGKGDRLLFVDEHLGHAYLTDANRVYISSSINPFVCVCMLKMDMIEAVFTSYSGTYYRLKGANHD